MRRRTSGLWTVRQTQPYLRLYAPKQATGHPPTPQGRRERERERRGTLRRSRRAVALSRRRLTATLASELERGQDQSQQQHGWLYVIRGPTGRAARAASLATTAGPAVVLPAVGVVVEAERDELGGLSAPLCGHRAAAHCDAVVACEFADAHVCPVVAPDQACV